MTSLLSTLATIWRLAIPYFRSEHRVAGRILLASVIAIELAVVAINVNTDLDYFTMIVPCGLAGKPVTSMQRELQKPLTMRDTASSAERP